jgi:hypothetical protein
MNMCALIFHAIDVTVAEGVLLGWLPVAGTWLCCLVHVPGSPLLHDHVAALCTTEIAHIPDEVWQPLHYRSVVTGGLPAGRQGSGFTSRHCACCCLNTAGF